MKRVICLLTALLLIFAVALPVSATSSDAPAEMPFSYSDEADGYDFGRENDGDGFFYAPYGTDGYGEFYGALENETVVVFTLIAFVCMLLFVPMLVVMIVFIVLNSKAKKKLKEYERMRYGGNNGFNAQPGNFNNNGFNTAPQGNFNNGGYNTAPQGNFNNGGYNTAPQGNFNNGGYNTAPQGNFNNGGYNTAPQGNFNNGGYNTAPQGNFNNGGFNTAPQGNFNNNSFNTAPQQPNGFSQNAQPANAPTENAQSGGNADE